MSIGILPPPDERICDMRRDLRSTLGHGPRGISMHLVNQELEVVEGGLYTANKSVFPNVLNKASWGARIGDIVIFKTHSEEDGDKLCTGIITAISGDTVSFQQYGSISIYDGDGDDEGEGGGSSGEETPSIEDIIRQMEQYQSTEEYMDSLLQRLNDKANNTGGYVYSVEGQGIRTYDVEVSDPAVGAEASSVLEIKGGTIRIADSRNEETGDWEWKTIFDAGHVTAEAVTALNVTTGWIRGANGTYIDLDSGTVVLGNLDSFHMVADANELGFYQGDARVAYVSNEMLFVPLAVGVNAIQVGGDEGDPAWQWKKLDNDNLRLRWIGVEEEEEQNGD